MINPCISIIIPTFNRAHCIEIALQSVLSQTYTEWECMIIDDGSTDDSQTIIGKWVNQDPRFHYYSRTRLPKGAPTCRNIGLEKAQGSYVVFLDSDDYLLSHCLEQRVAEILRSPQFDFLVFPMGLKKTNGIKKQEIPKSDDYLVPFLSANLHWQTMCPIWKTSFIKSLNGFTEGYQRFNDPELMIRAFLKASTTDYKVYTTLRYDSVHIRDLHRDESFSTKVYNSLLLFIPDVCRALEHNNKTNYRNYLAGYLHLWFKYIFTPINIKNPKQSIQLLVLFYKQDIISSGKMINLMLRLFIYLGSNLLLKRPVNKLVYRDVYY